MIDTEILKTAVDRSFFWAPLPDSLLPALLQNISTPKTTDLAVTWDLQLNGDKLCCLYTSNYCWSE
jgi:hypothetical protein